MEELKKCPFCGDKGRLITSTSNTVPRYATAWCVCSKCGSTGACFGDIKGDGEFVFKAIEAWNRREGD